MCYNMMLGRQAFLRPSSHVRPSCGLSTPPRSSHASQLLSRWQSVPVSPLAATLIILPASVAKGRLGAGLSSLAATLTKKRGTSFKPKVFLHSPQLAFLRSEEHTSELQSRRD